MAASLGDCLEVLDRGIPYFAGGEVGAGYIIRLGEASAFMLARALVGAFVRSRSCACTLEHMYVRIRVWMAQQFRMVTQLPSHRDAASGA